jgi:hypothetical protein
VADTCVVDESVVEILLLWNTNLKLTTYRQLVPRLWAHGAMPSSSHSSSWCIACSSNMDCGDGCFLGCSVMWTGISWPAFQKSVLPPSWERWWRQEDSETSVNSYQSTRHNNPENSHLHTYRRENLKSNMNCIWSALPSSFIKGIIFYDKRWGFYLYADVHIHWATCLSANAVSSYHRDVFNLRI